MMQDAEIPRDDILDVMEMTEKIEYQVSNILKDNDMTLSMSALMSATINCVMGQCKSLEEIFFYRNTFVQLFDSSIRSIVIEE